MLLLALSPSLLGRVRINFEGFPFPKMILLVPLLDKYRIFVFFLYLGSWSWVLNIIELVVSFLGPLGF